MASEEAGVPVCNFLHNNAKRGVVNFGSNIALQPESITSYSRNQDLTRNYLIRWKDTWLHESACLAFVDLVEDFWKTEKVHPHGHEMNDSEINGEYKITNSDNNDIINDGDEDEILRSEYISGDHPSDNNNYHTYSNNYDHSKEMNVCNMNEGKIRGVIDDATSFSLNDDNCSNGGNFLTTFSCHSNLIVSDSQTILKDTGIHENPNGSTNNVGKENFKEVVLNDGFEHGLCERGSRNRNQLLQSLDDELLNTDSDHNEISNQLGYHMSNDTLQATENLPSNHLESKRNKSVPKTEWLEDASKSRKNSPVECEICHKTLSSRNSLREHRIVVHLKNGRFPCEQCGKRFTHQRALRLHRIMHTTERKFVCQICHSSHKRERELLLHMREMHTNTQNYRCDVCFQCFKMKGSLKNHCFTEHSTMITDCIVCKQKLTTPFSIYTHCLKHAEPREFKCAQCGSEFKTKARLNKHLVTVHESDKKPYRKCPKCGKHIFSRSHYYEHVNSHDGNTNEIVRFKCTLCTASFQHSSSLQRHRIRHRPGGDLEYPKENPYLHMDESSLPNLCCKRCRKLYSSKSGYYDHIKRCRDGCSVKETCAYCNKTFSSKKTLKRHVGRKHGITEVIPYNNGTALELTETAPETFAIHS